jgi:hypothetical protein
MFGVADGGRGREKESVGFMVQASENEKWSGWMS